MQYVCLCIMYNTFLKYKKLTSLGTGWPMQQNENKTKDKEKEKHNNIFFYIRTNVCTSQWTWTLYNMDSNGVPSANVDA